MGKGSSSSLSSREYDQPQEQAYASQLASQADMAMTPAIAKSISQDTESARAAQLANRSRMRGISSTYLRGATTGAGGKSKLGQ